MLIEFLTLFYILALCNGETVRATGVQLTRTSDAGNSIAEPKKYPIFAAVMEILRHVHLRKIGEFDEKAILLVRKTSAITATAFAFGGLTDDDDVMGSCEKGSNRFIGNRDTDQQTSPSARF